MLGEWFGCSKCTVLISGPQFVTYLRSSLFVVIFGCHIMILNKKIIYISRTVI